MLGYHLDLQLSKKAMHGPSGCGKSKKWEASEGLILPVLCKEFSGGDELQQWLDGTPMWEHCCG